MASMDLTKTVKLLLSNLQLSLNNLSFQGFVFLSGIQEQKTCINPRYVHYQVGSKRRDDLDKLRIAWRFRHHNLPFLFTSLEGEC